jgi:hypothetical protein
MATAGTIVGPGNVGAGAGDGAFNLIAVDLNNPVTLPAGSYVASLFNYQFTNFSGFDTTGKISPILLTGGGTSFTPIAVGNSINYAGPTAFISVPFGGADAFTLANTTTIYGGLYWDAPGPFSAEPRMPVGYQGGGSSFVVYGGGFGPGANSPVVGDPISGEAGGSAEGFFSRNYNFSIEVDPTAVPEPSSFILALAGLGLLGWLRLVGGEPST